MAKICMVVHSHYPFDPRVRREATSLVENGHSVVVICLRDEFEKPRECVGNVDIYRLPLSKNRESIVSYLIEYLAFFVLATIYVNILYFSRRFQIIHVHNMPDFLVFSAILPRIFGSRVLLDVHDPMAELFISKYSLEEDSWFVKIIRLQEKISYSFPCLLLTVNESMRERIILYGVPPDKVTIIFNSPDLSLFKISKEPNGRRSSQDFSLVYSGTIAKRYGLDIAIRAMALLKREMPDLKLVIVGSGDYISSLDKLAIQLGVQDRVEFRGKVPFNKLLDILVLCDAGLSPHRNDCFWDLYFSTKILEYFAVGLPVISSRTRTIEAYLRDSVFYFYPEDVEGLANQIRLLRIRPDLIKEKKVIADQILSNLNWENEKKKLHHLVLELSETKYHQILPHNQE